MSDTWVYLGSCFSRSFVLILETDMSRVPSRLCVTPWVGSLVNYCYVVSGGHLVGKIAEIVTKYHRLFRWFVISRAWRIPSRKVLIND